MVGYGYMMDFCKYIAGCIFFLGCAVYCDPVEREDVSACMSFLSAGDLDSIKRVYAQYGDFDCSRPVSEFVRGLLRESSKMVSVSLHNEANTFGCTAYGTKIVMQTAYEHQINALNVAYYCSRMFESVEQKFEQHAWSEGDVTADEQWLQETIEAMKLHNYKAVRALISDHCATKYEVRALLDECVVIDESLVERERLAKACRGKVLCEAVCKTFGALCATDVLLYVISRSGFGLPEWSSERIALFGGSVVAMTVGYLVLSRSLAEYECTRIREVNNAVMQLIVERFLNGIHV